jgi:AraC-like DNA-binding protein
MDARVNAAIRMMMTQAANDPPSIEGLSRTLNLSSSRLRQLFKNVSLPSNISGGCACSERRTSYEIHS